MKNIDSIAVLGIGHMGRSYVKSLIELGIAPDRIVAINPSAHSDEFLSGLNVRRFASLDEALAVHPSITATIVASPTPTHLAIFKECAQRGIRAIFSEKPTVQNTREMKQLEALPIDTFFTAYLTHFSPAVDTLCDFLQERGLQCREAMALWGNNWPGRDRWMGPDRIEQIVHPLVTMMRIIGHDEVTEIHTELNTSHIPHVRQELIKPDEVCQDTTSGKITFDLTDGTRTELHVISSLNLAFQERMIDLVLVKQGEEFPAYKARIEWDTKDQGDHLRIIDARTNEIVYENGWKINKLQIQLKAFLDHLSAGKADKRLVDLQWASMVTRALDDVC